MIESKTLHDLNKYREQCNLVQLIKNPDALIFDRGIRAVGPNDEFPLPWTIKRLSGTAAYSIISIGGQVDNTVVSMIGLEDAEKVLEEINE